MRVLGINAYTHDASAALLSDGEIVCAAEEERFSRVKHTAAFPVHAIETCLRTAGISLRDVDRVAFYWDPWLTLRHRSWQALRHLPASLGLLRDWLLERDPPPVRGSVGALAAMLRLRRELGSARRVHYVMHHLAHAASAFFVSPFERAAIWTVDGTGERATSLLAAGRSHRIDVLREVPFPHSLGVLYGAVTQLLGFEVASDEWKVMALAAYGRPRHLPALRRLVELRDDGTFRLDLRYFRFQVPGATRWYSPRLADLLGAARAPDEPVQGERFVDVAASLQELTHEIALHVVRHLHRICPERALAIAGGVALNCRMNQFLVEHGPFERIFVQPAAHDAGCSLGVALHAHHQEARQARTAPLRHAYLGPAYGASECEQALGAAGVPFTRERDICARVADLLAEQNVVGWFQGRMEFGPRALGNRSILADPRTAAMRDRVNEKVKYRESFRPFAPSVPSERRSEFFEGDAEAPFMTVLQRVWPAARERIPAVVHVDGTARVQSVTRDANPRFHALLSRFGERTGVPVLLNTSLNVSGEPIACTPEDALRTFLASGLDHLALGDFLVSKGARPARRVA
jgi:carbamoyltransferase